MAKYLPAERLTAAIAALVRDDTWLQLKDLRAVLDHRGALPRGFVGSGDPNASGIPPQVALQGRDPRNQARTLPFDWPLDRLHVFRFVDVIEQHVRYVLEELREFMVRAQEAE